ncbi:putative short chain dehydrogenase/ reductase [Halenospora varia]|nr:putative short chain dehydrogenase/ reductase [Halenospora varia]
MAIPFREMVHEQRLDLPLLATTTTCSGRTYIVTGANTGLGFETAKHLVALKASKVIIACRNTPAGETAKAEIEATTGIRNVVAVWELDLAKNDSVKVFAKRVVETLDRLDGLIENAGVALDSWSMAEGHESCIKINVIGTMLLAVLLLPKMMEDAKKFGIQPHITVVTSEVSFTAKAMFDKVKDDPFVKMKIEDMTDRYQLSKLMQVFPVRELATLAPISRTSVVINLVNPGLCKTKLSRHGKFALRMVIAAANMLLGRTVEMGSRTILFGAVAGKESHGCYTSACEIKEWVSISGHR